MLNDRDDQWWISDSGSCPGQRAACQTPDGGTPWVLYPSVGGCGCCWWLVPTRVYLQIENMKLYMEMSIGEVFLDMPYRASRLTLYIYWDIKVWNTIGGYASRMLLDGLFVPSVQFYRCFCCDLPSVGRWAWSRILGVLIWQLSCVKVVSRKQPLVSQCCCFILFQLLHFVESIIIPPKNHPYQSGFKIII